MLTLKNENELSPRAQDCVGLYIEREQAFNLKTH